MNEEADSIVDMILRTAADVVGYKDRPGDLDKARAKAQALADTTGQTHAVVTAAGGALRIVLLSHRPGHDPVDEHYHPRS